MFDNETFVRGRLYATEEGEGLFVWDEYRYGWRQILGHCQFSVNKVKDKHGKIRRYVRNKYLKWS